MASDIEGTMFNLRVAIRRLTKQSKKEPIPQMIGMPVMDGVNLPQIDVPT